MNVTTRTVGGLAAVAALLSICATAVAQENPTPPRGPEAHAARMHERMEEHMHRLHDILNLTPEQDTALKAVADAMAPPAGGEHRHGDWKQMQSLTTPERLDHMAARMAEHQARFQRTADAIKRFYATLSPEQKRAFDALHEGHGMGFGHGGKGGWGGHEHHGMEGMDHGPMGAPPAQ